MLIGSMTVATLITGGSTAGYAPETKPNNLRVLSAQSVAAAAQQASGGRTEKPNVLFIMGDDIGGMQPSIYRRGLMVEETLNIDRIGREGAIRASSARTIWETTLHPCPRRTASMNTGLTFITWMRWRV